MLTSSRLGKWLVETSGCIHSLLQLECVQLARPVALVSGLDHDIRAVELYQECFFFFSQSLRMLSTVERTVGKKRIVNGFLDRVSFIMLLLMGSS